MNEPRHDPLALLLNARLGFRPLPPPVPAEPIIEDPECCGLMLPPVPATARALDEASGSLGGVRPPANVALGPDGSIYLLDRSRFQLKRFDPCCCRFETVPCLGGEGKQPRQLLEPGALAIGCGRLYVTQKDRVSIFSLKGFGLLGHLLPPPDKLPWQPAGVAVDSLGRIWVGDARGKLHRFTPHGRWELDWPLVPAPAHLAIDRQDRIYLIGPAAAPGVRVLDREGNPIAEPLAGPGGLRRRFAPLPFRVDAKGKLFLEPCCDPACVPKQKPASELWFDPNGDPFEREAPEAVLYAKTGTYRSRLIDSGIAQCVWHRVVLTGSLPQGTRVSVAAFCSDERFDDATLSMVGQWQRCATADGFDGDRQWDCLIRAAPGRYLSLELRFEGNGSATPAIHAILLEFPRISLRRYLPAVFGAESNSADFTDRFLALFDTTFRSIEQRVDHLSLYFDPASAPATTRDPRQLDFLSWLGSWVGVTLDRNWDTVTRRRLLTGAGARFDRRGTLRGLTEQLYVLLGFDRLTLCEPETARCGHCVPPPPNCRPAADPKPVALPVLVLEHFRLRRWLRVGSGQLDDAAVLWGEQIVRRTRLGSNGQLGVTRLDSSPDPERDPWLVHANRFSVFVPARVRSNERTRKGLENLVKAESPAGTQGSVQYVEPRFRVGVQSMLGFDAVIAAIPQGISLGATPLGAGSVLTEPPHLEGGPAIALDKEGRIGTTTLLA